MKPEEMTRDQLIEIVQRLPKTADGVTVVRGDTVYSAGEKRVREIKYTEEKHAYLGSHGCLIFSTRAAALAAQSLPKPAPLSTGNESKEWVWVDDAQAQKGGAQ